jgi:hypothetical protein
MRKHKPPPHTLVAGLIAGGLALALAVLLGVAIGATDKSEPLSVKDWLGFLGNIVGGGIGAIGAWLAFKIGLNEERAKHNDAKRAVLRSCLGNDVAKHLGLLKTAVENTLDSFDVTSPLKATEIYMTSKLPTWDIDDRLRDRLASELPEVYSTFTSLRNAMSYPVERINTIGRQVISSGIPLSVSGLEAYKGFVGFVTEQALYAHWFLLSIEPYEDVQKLSAEFEALGRRGLWLKEQIPLRLGK